MLTPAKTNPFLNCKTREELAAFLGVKTSVLTYFAYGTGKKYRSFEIRKKSGGFREISAPSDPLKEVQKKIADALESVYSNPPNSTHGFVTGRSIITNAERHLGKRLVLNFDLENFFPTIAGHRVYGLFLAHPFNFSKEVASTLAAICSYENKVPQGAPTSPIVSNLICFRLDRQLTAFAAKHRVFYSRYADDITVSTTRVSFPEAVVRNQHSHPPTLGDELREIVQSNGFLINPKKTRVGTPLNSKYVTGVKVNLKLNVPRNFVRQIRAMLHDWEANGLKTASARYNARFNLSEQNKDFVRVVAGKLSHLKKVKGHTDLAYRRLYNRFVRLEGKGNPVLPLGEIEELREKVFVMEGCSDKGLPKVGSSFVLNEKYLVTCRHTLEISDTAEFPPPLVRTAKFYPFYDFSEVSKRTVDVHAEYTSHEADIALLDISAADKTVAKSLKSADPAEPLLESKMDLYKVVGFPAYKPGMSPHVMPLAITGTQPNQYGVKEIYVSSKMIAGMSGGPVLNQKNEVVGMAIRGTSTRATGDDSVGYLFVPISEVLKLAEEKGMVFK